MGKRGGLAVTRASRLIIGLALLSLAVRLGFAFWTDWGGDEWEFFWRAQRFYTTGNLPLTGADSVSGEPVPGPLGAVLAGAPLHLSGGRPIGSALFVALLNFAAACAIAALYCRVFPGLPPLVIWAWVLFAPWTIVYTGVWHPSLLPPFAAAFAWGLWLTMRRPGKPAGWAVAGAALALALQIHVSAAALAVLAVVLLVLRVLPRPRPGWMAAGFLAGLAPLGPYFAARAHAGAPPWGYLTASVAFHPARLLDLPGVWWRYLSFATGETSRFYHPGALGLLGPRTAAGQPFLGAAHAFALAVSAALIVMAAATWVQGARWRRLARPGRLSPGERFDAAALLAPLVAVALFPFSVAAPAAHRIWILMPFAFHPVLGLLGGLPRPLRWARRRPAAWLAAYLLAANAAALAGYAVSPTTSPLWRAVPAAPPDVSRFDGRGPEAGAAALAAARGPGGGGMLTAVTSQNPREPWVYIIKVCHRGPDGAPLFWRAYFWDGRTGKVAAAP